MQLRVPQGTPQEVHVLCLCVPTCSGCGQERRRCGMCARVRGGGGSGSPVATGCQGNPCSTGIGWGVFARPEEGPSRGRPAVRGKGRTRAPQTAPKRQHEGRPASPQPPPPTPTQCTPASPGPAHTGGGAAGPGHCMRHPPPPPHGVLKDSAAGAHGAKCFVRPSVEGGTMPLVLKTLKTFLLAKTRNRYYRIHYRYTPMSPDTPHPLEVCMWY